MNLDEIVAGLALPAASRVDRRIAKKLLVENSPRHLRPRIEEGIEQLRWIAALKPSTCSLPAGKKGLSTGDPISVDEVSVLTLLARPEARLSALVDAVHRAVPYLVLLLLQAGRSLHASIAWKRPSLTHEGRVVLSGDALSAPPIDLDDVRPRHASFLAQLSFEGRHRADLAQLYESWGAAIVAAQVAEVTGVFQAAADAATSEERLRLLNELDGLTAEIAALGQQLRKATQVRDRVQLSTRLKQAEQQAERVASALRSTRPGVSS